MTGETGDYDHLIDWLDACTRIVEGCVPSDAVCRTIALTDERITWHPESPYAPLPDVPDGYNFHPWTIVDGSILGTIIGEWGLGYKIGDVFTDLTKLPPFTWQPSLIENLDNYPGINIGGLTGTGTAKIHFLNIFQGGRAVVRVDNTINIFNWQIVEVNKDLTSIPQETQTPIVIEVEIKTDGDHEIQITFFPTVDDAFIPLFFGGGIRSVELCGFGVSDMPDDPCCPDTNDKLETNNQLLTKIINLMESGITGTFNFGGGGGVVDGSGDYHLDCTPTNFDGEDDDTVPDAIAHRKALCYVVTSYLQALAYRTATLYNAPQEIFDFLLGGFFGQDIIPSMGSLVNQVSDTFTLATLAASATPEVMNEIICNMVTHLTGQPNTLKNFQTSVVPADFEVGTAEYLFAKLVEKWNQKFENYQTFTKTLEKGFKDGVLDGFECPCDSTEVCDPADFDIIAVNDCTVERVDSTHWHVTQLHHVPEGDDKRKFVATIRDSAWRCFNVVGATQGQSAYDNYTCDGGHFTGGGGGGGFLVQDGIINFEYNVDELVGIDTVIEIICPPGD